MDKEHSRFFSVDKYQIFIFQDRYKDASQKNSSFKEVENMDNLTDTEWDHFWNSYITNTYQNFTPNQNGQLVLQSGTQVEGVP